VESGKWKVESGKKKIKDKRLKTACSRQLAANKEKA